MIVKNFQQVYNCVSRSFGDGERTIQDSIAWCLHVYTECLMRYYILILSWLVLFFLLVSQYYYRNHELSLFSRLPEYAFSQVIRVDRLQMLPKYMKSYYNKKRCRKIQIISTIAMPRILAMAMRTKNNYRLVKIIMVIQENNWNVTIVGWHNAGLCPSVFASVLPKMKWN